MKKYRFKFSEWEEVLIWDFDLKYWWLSTPAEEQHKEYVWRLWVITRHYCSFDSKYNLYMCKFSDDRNDDAEFTENELIRKPKDYTFNIKIK